MNAARPVLVIGAAGQLGSALMKTFADVRAIGFTHGELDFEDPSAVARTLDELSPSVVINTAAFHNVDACERDPERAFAVNAFAVDRLAAACSHANARLVHISTDFVFDGEATAPYRETDATGPLNAYGASKVAGEHLLRRHGDAHVVVRTSALYGAMGTSSKGGSFPERILRQARAGEPLRVVDDSITAPSHTMHVAREIRAIVGRGLTGIYHVAGSGSCSWYTFATELLRRAGIDATITPVSSSAFPSIVRRPRYSVLGGDGLAAAGLPPLPTWREGIDEFLQELDPRVAGPRT